MPTRNETGGSPSSELDVERMSCPTAESEQRNQTEELAARLVEEGKPQEALSLLLAALSQKETARLWNDWATVQYGCGDVSRAEAGYRRALELNGSDRQVAVNLGLLLFALGRLQEAMSLLEQHRATLTAQEKQTISELAEHWQANQVQIATASASTPAVSAAPHVDRDTGFEGDAFPLIESEGARRPKVSVLMPSYNHARYVAAAIQSIQAQTFQDFEIVVTDDGSQDGTADVVAAMNEPRLRLSRFPVNRGFSAAINDALRRSRGEYLTFLNSDDCFLPAKLELQVAFLDAHPEIGAVFAYPNIIDETGAVIAPESTYIGRIFEVPSRSQSEWLRHFFFYGNCLCQPTLMIRRKCHEIAGFYDERLAQLNDFEMWVRMLAAFPIHVMKEPLTSYRVLPHSGNMSALRVDSVIRHEWEFNLILRHYLSLPTEMFAQVFAPEVVALGLDVRENRRAVLGQICLATNLTRLHRFALEVLFDALPPQSDGSRMAAGVTHARYRRETGIKDVHNTLGTYKIAQLEHRLEELEAGSKAAQAAGANTE